MYVCVCVCVCVCFRVTHFVRSTYQKYIPLLHTQRERERERERDARTHTQTHTHTHRQLSCARIDSEEGRNYLAGMAAAANYAWVNRSSMTFLVRQAFAKV